MKRGNTTGARDNHIMCWFVALLKKERREFQPEERREEKIRHSIWRVLKEKGE